MLKTWLGIRVLSFLMIVLGVAFTASAADNTVLFILDVSGSMAGRLDGGTRMDAAKQTFTKTVDELPKELNVGLELYGHHGDKDCSAIEVVVPPQPLNAEAIKAEVMRVKPEKGATPIADSLATAGETLREVKGTRTIVLISEGEETCGGDPVAVAGRLHQEIKDLKIHVIGFGVGDKGRAQLQAVATSGGGTYYDASDASALAESLKNIKEDVAVAKSKVLVKDGFDEAYLAEHWEVKNPNLDSIIVEDGFLQILTDLPADNLFEPTNLVLLNKELPKQWEAILRMRFTLIDAYEGWYKNQMAGIMLYKDKNNGIMLVMGSGRRGYSKEAVRFERVRQGKWVPGYYTETGEPAEDHEMVIRLQRIKRKFIASFLNAKGKWQKIGNFTELRSNYRLGIFALRGSDDARETLEKFDEFTLKEVE